MMIMRVELQMSTANSLVIDNNLLGSFRASTNKNITFTKVISFGLVCFIVEYNYLHLFVQNCNPLIKLKFKIFGNSTSISKHFIIIIYLIQMAVLAGLLFLALLSNIEAINFLLENKRCMKFEEERGKYVLEYVISGSEDENVRCTISEGEKIIQMFQGVSQKIYARQSFSQGKITICFQIMDSIPKDVSFEFYHEDDPAKKVIEKKELELVRQSLQKTYEQMVAISHNQDFHIERDQMHKETLEEAESDIKWNGVLKVVFLMASALIQLCIMARFFNNNSHPYQPVELS